jgi:hypothetical protein
MGWSNWFGFGASNKESSATKLTTKPDGSTKREIISSNDGDKQNHSHTWIDRDPSGKITGAGATPPKKER